MYKRNEMIIYLLKKKYNINFLTANGETLIQTATNYNNYLIIDLLLEININLNNKTNDNGLTILHQSVILDNFNLFNKLLNKNIDINLPDFYGNTALHSTVFKQGDTLMKLLLKRTDIELSLVVTNNAGFNVLDFVNALPNSMTEDYKKNSKLALLTTPRLYIS
jgi:ankyrin repeat protein